MPNLSKTTLNEEIDYDLYNYKINESSKVDQEDTFSPTNKTNQSIHKFVSIKNFRKMDNEIHPKFMNELNELNKSPKKHYNLNSSDQFEAQDIIDSINGIENSKDSKK